MVFVWMLVEGRLSTFLDRVKAQSETMGPMSIIDQVLDLSFLRAHLLHLLNERVGDIYDEYAPLLLSFLRQIIPLRFW
jgi:hypothetical protein